MELVNGVFYQASWEGASVAITADYLGLLPVSRVSRTKNPILQRGLPSGITIYPRGVVLFAETIVGARGRAPRDSSTTGVRIGQAQEEGGEGRHTAAEVKS